jgi:hypothetical protein
VPDCDQPPYNCEVHHLIEWSAEGTTDLDRLTMTCQDGNLSAGPTEDQWQARRRYDEETLGQPSGTHPNPSTPTDNPRPTDTTADPTRHDQNPTPPRCRGMN